MNDDAKEETKENDKIQLSKQDIFFNQKKLNSQEKENLINKLFSTNNKSINFSNKNDVKFEIKTNFNASYGNAITSKNDFLNMINQAKNNVNNNKNNLNTLINNNHKSKIRKTNKLRTLKDKMMAQNAKRQKQEIKENNYIAKNKKEKEQNLTKTKNYRNNLANEGIKKEFIIDDYGLMYDSYSIKEGNDKFVDELIYESIKQQHLKDCNTDNKIAAYEFKISCFAFTDSNIRTNKDALDLLMKRNDDDYNIINMMTINNGTFEYIGTDLVFKIYEEDHQIIEFLAKVHGIYITDDVTTLNCGKITNNNITIEMKKFGIDYGISHLIIYNKNLRKLIGNKVHIKTLTDAINTRKRIEMMSAIEETFSTNITTGDIYSDINLNWFLKAKKFQINDENDFVLPSSQFPQLDQEISGKLSSFCSTIQYIANKRRYDTNLVNMAFPLDVDNKLITNIWNVIKISNNQVKNAYLIAKNSNYNYINSDGIKLFFINKYNIIPNIDDEYMTNINLLYPRTYNVLCDPFIMYKNNYIGIFNKPFININKILRNIGFKNCDFCGSIGCPDICPALQTKLKKAIPLFKKDVKNVHSKIIKDELEQKVKNYKPLACWGCNQILRYKSKHVCAKKNFNFFSGEYVRNFSVEDSYNAGIIELLYLKALYKIIGKQIAFKQMEDISNHRKSDNYNNLFGMINFEDCIEYKIIDAIVIDSNTKEAIIKNNYIFHETKGIIIKDYFVFFDKEQLSIIHSRTWHYQFKGDIQSVCSNTLQIKQVQNNKEVITDEIDF